jgi:hypothetical protein
MIDEVAQRARPEARSTYRRAMAAAAAALAAVPSEAPPSSLRGAALAREAFALFARLEEARKELAAGATAALTPALLEGALRRMSRTFAEGVEQKARKLRGARRRAGAAAAAAAAALIAQWAPRVAEGAAMAEVAAAWRACISGAGTELYSAALLCWAERGEDIGRYAEEAKDRSLGLEPDTPAAIRASIAAREGLHPLQAMGLTFGLVPARGRLPPGEAGEAAVRIAAALPQAETAVRYHPAPLIDVEAAARFGPLASSVAGLNFRLVQRLQAVVEEPLPPGGEKKTGIEVDPRKGRKGVVRSIDRGRTFERMEGGLPPSAYEAIGAGPRPRVERLGELLEAAVFGPEGGNPGGGTRVFSDPERLVADAEASAEAATPLFSLDELGQALQARFAAEYDAWAAAAPPTGDGFLAAMLGQRSGRDLYKTYLAETLARVEQRGGARLQLRSELVGHASAALFGSRALGAAATRQELLLTQLANLQASILAVQRSLRQAFASKEVNGATRAREIFAGHRRGEADGKRAEAVTRQRALALYRAVLDQAFFSRRRPKRAAQAVEKGGEIEATPSLKEFLLEHGASPAGPAGPVWSGPPGRAS